MVLGTEEVVMREIMKVRGRSWCLEEMEDVALKDTAPRRGRLRERGQIIQACRREDYRYDEGS